MPVTGEARAGRRTPDEDSPFADVERLVALGRWEDAARALKRSARGRGPAWEAFLWLGRIEERRAHPAEAERAYRKAFDINPASPVPRVELSRFLHQADRTDEALELLKGHAARAADELSAMAVEPRDREAGGRVGEDLLFLLEYGLYRRAFFESLDAAGERLDRIETALRRALAEAPQARARTLLAELLIAGGRLEAAEEELAAAFRSEAVGADSSRLHVLLRLIDSGRYGPVLERAARERASRSRAGDVLRREWPQVFSALMCAQRYSDAFRLGEAMLEQSGGVESPGELLYPWRRRILRAVGEKRLLTRELVRLRSAARSGDFPHWFAYYRAILLHACDRDREALLEFKTLRGLDPERYSWMLESFVLVQQSELDLDGAVETCRAVLERAPAHWWVRCRLGEAYLAKGDVRSCLREFESGLEAAGPAARREVLTWSGEIFLWLGEYGKALERLDEAVRLGARNFVHGWRGAARFLSGDIEGALADLDQAVAMDAKDLEARGWRGEVYRVLGRNDEALRDLDHVIGSMRGNFWMLVNRALLKGSLGDARGMAADFEMMRSQTPAMLRRAWGLRPHADLGPDEMKRILEDGLRRARGIRRWEPYVQLVWLTSPR